jgi:hypothetical protein
LIEHLDKLLKSIFFSPKYLFLIFRKDIKSLLEMCKQNFNGSFPSLNYKEKKEKIMVPITSLNFLLANYLAIRPPPPSRLAFCGELLRLAKSPECAVDPSPPPLRAKS